MPRFVVAHATHPDWRAALALCAAQLQPAEPGHAEAAAPTLGWVYFSDHYVAQAEALYAALRDRWPGVAWVGAVGVGVAASGVEYFDEPALVLMLAALPVGRFQVFSGAQPLARIQAHTAMVHTDATAHDLAGLLEDMSSRTTSGYLFGGLASSRTRSCHIANGVFEGGLSGVAFSRDVGVLSRVSQGCQPIGPLRRITACERNVVTRLDGEPALACLLRDLGLDGQAPRETLAALRNTLVGLSGPADADAAATGGADAAAGRPDPAPQAAARRAFGEDVRVRHLIGLDPAQHGVAVAELLHTGLHLAFCQRDMAAARRDLVRICAEMRDALAPDVDAEPEATGFSAPMASGPVDATARIAGAVYVSCAGRGGPHFGAPSAELQIVKHALGDVPLVGFFAGGEIGHQHLYGYTGVLTVFTQHG